MFMKSFLCSILAFSLIGNIAFAECDFSTGITKESNGYLYSNDCHLKVGEMKRDLGIAQKQVSDLNQAIDLKNVALDKSNQRADLWQNTSIDLEKRIDTLDSVYSRNKWLYFGLGVIATGAAVYLAGQLNH